MHNKNFDSSSKLIKQKYDIDVVKDLILLRSDRLILFGDTSNPLDVELIVISGNLEDYGFSDTHSIHLKDIIDCFDNSNKYAEVAGIKEYYNNTISQLLDFSIETNITFPILVNKKRIWIRVNTLPLKEKTNLNGFFITDVTKYLIEEEKIFEKTHKDALTNLFNKYTLDYHYGLRHKKENFHVMYLDLDDFKIINDTYDHATGNEYLVSFSNILKKHEHDYTRFYRIGGDEFVGFVFQPKESVLAIAKDILHQTRNITTENCKQGITVSIGIAKAINSDDLIRKADKVQYDVKKHGKNAYKYYTEDEIK